MKFIKTPLAGAYEIAFEPFEDSRGTFARMFCKKELARIGLEEDIVQAGYSVTRRKGSIRGMHYQAPPHAETKIVTCLTGSALDVIVDLRAGSKTFLKHYATVLSPGSGRALLVPKGFAHGFQTREGNTAMLYFITEYYAPAQARTVRYNDPRLGIAWPSAPTEISEKDGGAPLINAHFRGLKV